MDALRSSLFAFSALLLASCGFQPVYAPQGTGVGQVTVAQIEGRTGYFVRNELVRLSQLERDRGERPALTVSLVTLFRDASTRGDSFSDRTLIEVTARWTLENGETDLTGEIKADTGFDSRDAAYGGVVLQADAEERLAATLARSIWADIRAKRGRE
jgi:LPS-assembly lipoprotein